MGLRLISRATHVRCTASCNCHSPAIFHYHSHYARSYWRLPCTSFIPKFAAEIAFFVTEKRCKAPLNKTLKTMALKSHGSRDGSVGRVTGYRLPDRGIVVPFPPEAKYVSSLQNADRLWGPPSLLLPRHWGSLLGVKRSGR